MTLILMNNNYHTPVLLKDSVDGLSIKPDGIYVDLTFGGGGHSREILNRLGQEGQLIAFDQDEDAKNNLPDDERLVFVDQNFCYLKNYLKFLRKLPVDGVLADLGVSSHQFNTAERGFSLRFEGALDMRMNQEAELTAHKVVNEYAEEDLTRVFKFYGELREAKLLANRIVYARNEEEIKTINELKTVLNRFAKKGKEHSFFAKVFQALRIEVNQEMEVLEDMLMQLVDVVKPGGFISIISYHSLEDRLVKNFIKSGNLEGKIEKDFYGNVLRPFKEVNRKVIVPTEQEIEENNRARSAKLRIAQRIGE